jgi:hypothetical protein
MAPEEPPLTYECLYCSDVALGRDCHGCEPGLARVNLWGPIAWDVPDNPMYVSNNNRERLRRKAAGEEESA